MNSTTIQIEVLALILPSLLGGCREGPPNIRPRQANVASLDPQDWYIFYSEGEPPHPVADPSGAWSFTFPGGDGRVNYIQTPFNATIVLHNVNLTFRVESSTPQYRVIDTGDILPATVHLFFEQQNDSGDANGRWWADFSNYDLGSKDNTTITLVIPLAPDQWSNVYGKQDATAFYAALANIGWIGVTCGGQYFWGHGVVMSTGTAKYILVDLSVN